MSRNTLGQIKCGCSGVVTKINATGALKRRLVEMGITPGVEIFVCRTAPFGDPVQIKLRGYLLMLRKADAEQILVLPI